MAKRTGRCTNFGGCNTADSKRSIEILETQEFVCPECKSNLISADGGGNKNSSSLKKGLLFAIGLIVVVIVVVLFGKMEWVRFGSAVSGSTKPVGKSTLDRPINVCVVTWGGYAGGEYFNNGFKASKDSRYYKDYGIQVEFLVIDDFQNSRDAWKAGKCDLLWITADSFPTEAASLKEFEPQIIFQSDWSRGGDAIVVKQGITSVKDLKKKKVSVAFGTPSHTFLLRMLESSNLKYKDIIVVEAPSAVDSATYFKAGKVDAAVVWSPDDEDCVKNVPGAKVLQSTRTASNIIADVFYAKKKFIEEHRYELTSLLKGWLIGAAEINNDKTAKDKAVKILTAGLNQPEDFIRKAIDNARLTTYGDNLNFFGMNSNYVGMKGEDLYVSMSKMYSDIGLVKSQVPSWRNIVDVGLLKDINLSGKEHEAEIDVAFAPVVKKDADAIATKSISINFLSGSAELDENAKIIIDEKLSTTARAFAKSRIRVEGNTDNVGSADMNQQLSLKRAQSVVDYLLSKYKFDPNRFVVIGNGPRKPLANNTTADGRAKNRRTDFELIGE